MTAMILAAGRGERLRPVTDTVPKAMVEVGGEKLIDRHLSMLAKAGVETVVINLGWLGEKIVDHLGTGKRFGVHVVYSPEYDNVLETGGGICRALPVLGGAPFWVINADIHTDMSLPSAVMPDSALAHLVLVPAPSHKPKGDFDLIDGMVRNGTEPACTFSGVARYRPEFFAGAGDGRFSVAPMLRQAADDGRLSGSIYSGAWEDVGTPERLAELNRR
jgi:MurNAc alpha-1-phosphate uridylyltransferase